MARKEIVVVEYTDDLDGTETNDIETVKFGYKGTNYTIDLNEKNRKALDSALEKFLKVAHEDKGAKVSGSRSTAPSNPDIPQIRSWAIQSGLNISMRGRIHGDIIDAYYNGGKITESLRQRFGFPEVKLSEGELGESGFKAPSKAAAKK